jgi:MFS family permease
MATVATEAAGGRFLPRLHWSAVIAGVFLALAAHVVLGLIGAALGFAAEPADSEALGAGAAAWGLVTPFVASLLGAWLAVRLSGEEDKVGSNVHGILVWCIGLIAGALFLTGTLATGAMSAGTAASGNLGAAERMMGGAPARGPAEEARADEVGRAGAAAAGGAALAAIVGLLGAVIGTGLATRRGKGRGLGWRIAIQRQDERREGALRGAEAGTYGTSYGVTPESRGVPGGPAAGPPSDPFHH